MGAWLTNLTLRDVQPAEVVAWMRQRARSSFVSSTIDRAVVVCDHECDEHKPEVLSKLASELSKAFGCVVLAASVADSDVLHLLLFESGHIVMHYNSCPAYFDEGDSDEPTGADAPALCRAFGSNNVAEVQATLEERLPDDPSQCSTDDPDSLAGVFAEFRLAKVARLLGLPEIVWKISYGSLADEIAQGATTPGVNIAAFTKTP